MIEFASLVWRWVFLSSILPTYTACTLSLCRSAIYQTQIFPFICVGTNAGGTVWILLKQWLHLTGRSVISRQHWRLPGLDDHYQVFTVFRCKSTLQRFVCVRVCVSALRWPSHALLHFNISRNSSSSSASPGGCLTDSLFFSLLSVSFLCLRLHFFFFF